MANEKPKAAWEQDEISSSALAQADTFRVLAENYSVDSSEDAEAAAEDLRNIVSLRKTIEEKRVALKQPSLDESRAIDAHFKKPKDFLDTAERTLKNALIGWQQREQLRVDEENRQAELRRQEELRNQQNAIDEQIDDARGNGYEEFAQELENTVLVVPEAQKEQVQQFSGMSTSRPWKARVTDKMALIKAIANGEISDAFLIVDEKALNLQAKSLKGALKIPGVEAFQDTVMSVRS